MVNRHAWVVVLSACAVLVWSGAGHAREKITFTPKGSAQQPAKPASCEIQVFQDATPEQEYIDLGIINYHDERHRSKSGALKLEVVLPKIRAHACKAGADALIDIRVTEVRRLEFTMFNVRASAVKFVVD